jgi:ParB family chromosome partitioning protein
MARKISFDAPVEEIKPVREESAPHRSRPLLGLERAIKQSSAVGAISQSLGGISERVKRAEDIERNLIEGQVIVELDPALVDNSFVQDRMDATVAQNAAFREIIRQHGQNVPILVRQKSSDPERYEVAFGHRRLRAARELGIKVRAVVRSLTDEELVNQTLLTKDGGLMHPSFQADGAPKVASTTKISIDKISSRRA